MYGNIVLAGGTSMMSGFSNRIMKELPFHLDNNEKQYYNLTNISAEGNRNIAAWVGASMVASMSTINNVFITKDEIVEGEKEKILQKIF